ncbi:phosphotransferase [Dermabacteraceae bacterium TAE3-ERU5]|nr:phosphotransferase [Dermabacteraceae bacterium TAE3-ERU5]
MNISPDGYALLTTARARGVLARAVASGGGQLIDWELDHVDHRPGRSTKALYRARVCWPELDGAGAQPREEMLGAAVHGGEPEPAVVSADASLLLQEDGLPVRVWRFPRDPWLPCLAEVCYPAQLVGVLRGLGFAVPEQVPVKVLSYRPGRRAVLSAKLPEQQVFLKVMPPSRADELAFRHAQLRTAGVPVPEVLAHGPGLLVFAQLSGGPLTDEIVRRGAASCHPASLINLLDSLPPFLAASRQSVPWTESCDFYADVIARAVPSLTGRVQQLAGGIADGLAAYRDVPTTDVVHGDFYEAQLFVSQGRVSGLLDIDTLGAGRRVDDLACMMGHLSIWASFGERGGVSREAQENIAQCVREWRRVFERRVDRRELAVRSAGVALSLATGPHRQQEDGWQETTAQMVAVAETWLHNP